MQKTIKKITMAVLITWLCLSVQTSGVFAAAKVEVRIPVSVILTGTVPAQEENYSIQLTPEGSRTPMPEGCKDNCEIIIRGENTVYFPVIVYTVPGVYGYAVSQTAGDNEKCTYDDTVYYVRVTVTNAENGGLEATVSAHKNAQLADKKQMIVFDNTYTVPCEPEKTVTETKNASSLIQTGQLNWPVPILAGTGGVLILCGACQNRKRKTKDAENIR